MPGERSCPGPRLALMDRAAGFYGEGDADAAGWPASV